MFAALGFSALTESVYLALLKFPDIDLNDLARRLGVDEARIRGALDDLVQMSLLRDADSDTPTLLDPEVGLAALVARQQRELARRQHEIEESRAAFTALLADHAERRPKTPEPGVHRLVGVDEIRRRTNALSASCEWEACSFVPGGAQSEADLKAGMATDADAVERGVRLRRVYLDSVRNHQATLEYAEWLSELGGEIRTVPTLPVGMLIVDQKLALVPMNNDSSGNAALLIGANGVVTGLYALFKSVWKAATPLRSARRRDDDGLSAQERQVLKLLAEGHTDETIGRRMGVSLRTARRTAADLSARLGARSRFQAGVLATARGWINPDDLDWPVKGGRRMPPPIVAYRPGTPSSAGRAGRPG